MRDNSPFREILDLTSGGRSEKRAERRISPEVLEITRTSLFSGITRSIELPITEEQWNTYQDGDYIQRALGHLNESEREFILSGATQEEWDTLSDDDES